jgi:hypothetical protein
VFIIRLDSIWQVVLALDSVLSEITSIGQYPALAGAAL